MAKFIFLCLFCAMGYVGFSQSTRQKLNQVKNDPATTTRSAQADVKQVDKKAPTRQATAADLRGLHPKKQRMHRKAAVKTTR